LRRFLFILILGCLVAGAASAKTPDGMPPSEETICDNETGAAFGLCNAYCEAMDCDSPNHHASDIGCESVRRNFERKTDRPMPCEVVCPCVTGLTLFAQIVNGDVTVEACLADETSLSVIVEGGGFALVTSVELPAFCIVSGLPPMIEITPAEEIACRDVLRRAAEEQGISCVSPE
jgi:hypothetical protein